MTGAHRWWGIGGLHITKLYIRVYENLGTITRSHFQVNGGALTLNHSYVMIYLQYVHPTVLSTLLDSYTVNPSRNHFHNSDKSIARKARRALWSDKGWQQDMPTTCLLVKGWQAIRHVLQRHVAVIVGNAAGVH
eukprot:1285140-Pyramimonas_sp.AAC.1